MKQEFSVVRIKTETLKRIRKLSAEFNTTVPRMLDLMTNSYEITRDRVYQAWMNDAESPQILPRDK